MKISHKIWFFLMTFMFGIVDVFADAEPPAPTSAATTMSFSSTPPPPPGLPIEENLIVLLIVALLFGFYKIYCSMDKKKRPV